MWPVRVDGKAWIIFGAVLAALWLAVERDLVLAGVAIDSLLGWGLLGVAVWVAVARGVGRTAVRVLSTRHDSHRPRRP
jgi:hypothetical protein